MKLGKDFFNRDPKTVAKELLGKIIVRKFHKKVLKARIVETEAYYDDKDPSSWARFNGDSKRTMEMDAGTILVKMVHNNWLFNIVTDEKGKASAVLIRAIEPLNFNERTNGPGLLTKALGISKKFHKKSIINNEQLSIISLDNPLNTDDIQSSHRVGVTKDLDKPLRFYFRN